MIFRAIRFWGGLYLFMLCSSSCTVNKVAADAESVLTGKSVTISGTVGWVTDDRYIRSHPSNVITHNGYTYVFYVKEPVNTPHTGTGYGGTIHYAFSRDQGNTWSDQGLLISVGLPGQFDAFGVAKPAIIKATDDNFFYLYYVGVSEGFDDSTDGPHNKTSIGLAKLIFNDDGGIRIAIKLNSAMPVLEPSEPQAARFDSYQVDDPNPINMNGQVWLYYTGYDKWHGTARTGLAVSADINKGHVKQNGNRAVLDGSPSLIQKQEHGVFAIFTDTQNVWFAADGLQFKKLKQKFPTPVKNARANNDLQTLSWGLAQPSTALGSFNKWEIK
jgi:hypothetical protein